MMVMMNDGELVRSFSLQLTLSDSLMFLLEIFFFNNNEQLLPREAS